MIHSRKELVLKWLKFYKHKILILNVKRGIGKKYYQFKKKNIKSYFFRSIDLL